MTFWAYMLHCRGGSFYVGHTDDIERRIAEHKSGLIPGYTAERLPVELVWSADFPTRDQAKEAERKVKGWSRAKKLALIRGDWAMISALAKKKDGPSTGSGQAGEGGKSISQQAARRELVEGPDFLLHPHPATPPRGIARVEARILEPHPHWLRVRWRVDGAGSLVVPPFAGKGRADGLWRTTCFEMFLKPSGGEGYLELNLSPSERWNAYAFDRYREGMREAPMPRDPVCTIRQAAGTVIFDAAVPMSALPQVPCELGLTAVIEEEGGHLSYWALAHPEGRADFHAPACFAATLPAPVGA